MMSSGISYEPSDGMPMVTHLPFVPRIQSCTWSIAALAADAADDNPRASMIAAPRLPTVGMNVLRFHSSSLISLVSDSPSTVAKRKSGYMVGEWLPHTASFSIEATGLPDLAATCEPARVGPG